MSGKNVERLVKHVVQGAAFAFALWLIANRFQVNGVGWLESQGWPFSNVYLLVAAGALVGAVVGLVRWGIGGVRSREVGEVAQRMEFDFQPEVSRADLGEA